MKLRMNEVNAAVWKRVLAYITDAIIINIIVVWPFQKTITRLSEGFASENVIDMYKYINANPGMVKNVLPELTILFAIIAILTITYWAALEYKTKQSLGKILMRIHVTSDDKELTLKQCIIRNISKISGLLLIIDCIGVIGNRQRFLERLSKTRVVEKRFTI